MHLDHDPAAPAAQEIGFDDFLKVDIRVGTIVAADVYEGARKPSYKLRIDFGPGIGEKKSVGRWPLLYSPEELVGRQVAAVVNFPARQIGKALSEVLTMGFADEEGRVVLFSPDKAVPNGSRLFLMAGLGTMIAEAEPLEGGFALDITEDWLQGRTAYGGLTSAIALAAARGVSNELAPLRSGQFSMIAPLAGRVEARARVLRQGRNATWVAAELTGEGGVGFTASFVFMRPIESVLSIDHYALPEGVIPLGDAPPVPMDQAPAFLRNHFEVRFAMPKASLGEADLCWWVRPRKRGGLHPEVEAVLCGDVLPVAVWPLLSFRVPISSMQWHVNVLDPRPDADGWWLIRSTSEHAAHGGASEHIMQWRADGTPAIAGMQSVAVFG